VALGRDADAQPLFERCLSIRAQTLSADHVEVGLVLTHLALLRGRRIQDRQSESSEVEELYRRALAVWDQHPGVEQLTACMCRHNLAFLYHSAGRYAEAEPLYRQTVAILGDLGWWDRTETAHCLYHLGQLYRDCGRHESADTFFRQARMVWVRLDQLRQPAALRCLREHTDLLRRMRRSADAAELEFLIGTLPTSPLLR
jgi:tetratricopeptide (TPR) repeat protein